MSISILILIVQEAFEILYPVTDVHLWINNIKELYYLLYHETNSKRKQAQHGNML